MKKLAQTGIRLRYYRYVASKNLRIAFVIISTNIRTKSLKKNAIKAILLKIGDKPYEETKFFALKELGSI
jgi:hypothetical protein